MGSTIISIENTQLGEKYVENSEKGIFDKSIMG